jgi:hypothetical protein
MRTGISVALKPVDRRRLTTVARIATHRITMCSFDEQSIIFPSCEAALLTSLG